MKHLSHEPGLSETMLLTLVVWLCSLAKAAFEKAPHKYVQGQKEMGGHHGHH